MVKFTEWQLLQVGGGGEEECHELNLTGIPMSFVVAFGWRDMSIADSCQIRHVKRLTSISLNEVQWREMNFVHPQ